MGPRNCAQARLSGGKATIYTRRGYDRTATDAIVPSKEELAAYWQKVAKRALQYLGGRPLKLVRHVRGTTFYHKGPLPPIPATVRQLKVKKREGGEGTRLWVEDLEGLLGLVEIGAVELHPWNNCA